jgi:muramoyltetrapeptide carboxypeptidase
MMTKGKAIGTKTPTIGVVTVSAPEAVWYPSTYKQGKQALIDRGCKIIDGNTAHTSYLYLADTPKRIASALKQMFADDNIDAIMCAGGGNCMNKILPYIDYDFIKLHYKPFIGISDVTALLLALLNKGIVSFHGPCVIWNYGLVHTPTTYTHDNLMSILNGFSGDLPAKSKWQIYRRGVASGKLIGGNLSTIAKVIGTKHCPVELFTDSLLFIEDVEEDYAELDSTLTRLRQFGVFERINGVIFGKLKDCEPPEKASKVKIADFIGSTFEGYKFPIIYNCDFGHVDDNLCLPLGCHVILHARQPTELKLTLIEPGVAQDKPSIPKNKLAMAVNKHSQYS